MERGMFPLDKKRSIYLIMTLASELSMGKQLLQKRLALFRRRPPGRLQAPVHSPADAAALVMYEMSALPQKHLRVMNLDTRNKVHNIEKLYVGSLNASTVRVGEIFISIIQRSCQIDRMDRDLSIQKQ